MAKTKVFISFDYDHDETLKEFLVGQAKLEDSPFELADWSIKEAIDETTRRRTIQLAYNEEHGLTPISISKGVSDIAEFLQLEAPHVPGRRRRGSKKVEGLDRGELEKLVITLEEEMLVAAEELRFEYAAKLRDEIKDLRRELNALQEAAA